MVWCSWVFETMTGVIHAPIDLPKFAWSVDVSDSSLATLKDKGVGDLDLSGVTVPWGSVPGDTMQAKRRILAPDRYGIMLAWASQHDLDMGLIGKPVVAASIGVRTDTAIDTSFNLTSPFGLLDHRYLVREGKYGTGKNGTSPDSIKFTNLSYRGIASEIGWQCTDAKPSGALPIDWTYRGERGTRTREYSAWDIQNNGCRKLLTDLSNIQNGPDMQLRPYLPDQGHLRFAFLAGSDSDIWLGQKEVHSLGYAPYAGALDELTVDHLGAVHRVYASGAGTDAAQITAVAEDLTLLRKPGVNWPLRESTYSDSDTDNLAVLKAHAAGMLAANDRPLMQITASVYAADTNTDGAQSFPVGDIWPGELVKLDIRDYPPLPDGVYSTRLMRMSGDNTNKIELVFDVMEDISV
ncbi:hypothetical protein D2E22_1697 [Bifidobacterium castoris]|uniref:Uncharacterized protein n=2 Tax=Bifidobacterium castoris TaxID=2306972 RepID=A0A430F5G7_9BIFI|nr:hypothetical protein D2E22_1697 [Bifidobacterium castoris]